MAEKTNDVPLLHWSTTVRKTVLAPLDESRSLAIESTIMSICVACAPYRSAEPTHENANDRRQVQEGYIVCKTAPISVHGAKGDALIKNGVILVLVL